jgi:pilus assembly protein Flp/PilA
VVQLVEMWVRFRGQFARDDEKGASLVEYALLVALIAVVCIVAISFLGTNASQTFSSVGSSVGGVAG